ncbi:MAG: GNAT family N-acetyltransferase [Candidatus Hydrogenedentes bacterium]|nr:GNAT family N-acetyltransferase [Candidatus Hydrogenedentota bacterium]
MASENHVEVRKAGSLSEEERALINDWTQRLFGAAELEHEWADPDWRILVWCTGALASHLAICERVALAGGAEVKLAGIGSVMTPPEWQGRGLASAAMCRAAEFMRDELLADFGFLLCSETLVPMYARLGWQVVPGPMVFAQSTGMETWHEAVMVLPCTARDWPEGLIDLCGPPW